ncbi:MAG: inorganic pyrophosphatase Ppa [Deltaproteobacteria bacterium]|nr:inorganic pyrophosphatase Ppa [Deltaproteobacteria bacterium]
MPLDLLLEKAKRFEVETYRRPEDITLNHVAFSGALEKHPHDPEKILLVSDPFSATVSCIEFSVNDIKAVEALSSLVTVDGKSVKTFTIWVLKGSVAIRYIPFIVEDTRQQR